MELIIQPEEVGILARPLSQHIDREQLVAYITEVEQLQIRSALGGVLFSEIKQSPSTFDIILNGGSDEVGEVSGGIRKAMAYYVYARVIREGGTIPTRWGAVEKTDEYATRLDQEQKNTIYRECNNIADAYMAEVVNYAKAQGWIDAQGANPTRRMAYVVGSEEADADKMPCKSRQSVNANLVAGDGINIVDGEISVNMSEVQRGTGMTALAQRVTNAETNIEEVRRLATQREEVTVGNGLIKDDKGSISVDFEVVASNAEITNIRTTANEAKKEARQAKKLAEDAISTLEAINQIASDAETTAQRAKTEADSAVTTAVDAVGVAGSALTTAGQATETANDALLKANSAQTSATNAENSAKASALSASSAKTSAENAKKSAEEVAKGISSIDGKVSESVSKAVDGAFGDVNQALTKQAEELETKAPKVGYAPDLKVDFAKELVGRGVAAPQEIGTIRPTGVISIGDGNASIEKVKGNSLVWNQKIKGLIAKANNFYGLSMSISEDGVISINGTVTADFVNPFVTEYGKAENALAKAPLGRYVLDVKIINNPDNINLDIYAFNSRISFPKSSKSTTSYKKIGDCSSLDHRGGFGLTSYGGSGTVFNNVCFKISLYNLTQMFGAGNEPTTIEEFEARKPLGVSDDYNEGEIISYDAKELKSVGFNAFNGTYAKVIGGQKYHAYGTITSIGFTTELGGETTAITLDSEGMFTPAEDGYVYAEGTDICIHLTHTYTPEHTTEYEEDTLRLPNIKSIKDKDGNPLFPYGLLSAGTAHDEITATKAVKRIGVVDMGTLSWYAFTSNIIYMGCKGGVVAKMKESLTPTTRANILCSIYKTGPSTGLIASGDKTVARNAVAGKDGHLFVYDSSYADATSFKQAMQGVLLYYELAEPIEVDLPEPLNITYDAWDFGTEELIAEGKTTPLNADIVYQFNAVDRIRENTTNVSEIEEEVATKQQELTLTVLDNGNIRIGNLQGQTKDFMPATPSGDPMHYAYITAGALYNDTDKPISRLAPWKTEESWVKNADGTYTYSYADVYVQHLPGHWYLNGLGDITNEDMAVIYDVGRLFVGVDISNAYGSRSRTFLLSKKAGIEGKAFNLYYFVNQSNVASVIVLCDAINCSVSNMHIAFDNTKLIYVLPNLTVDSITVQSSISSAFKRASSLRFCNIRKLRISLSFSDSPQIYKCCILYLINNVHAELKSAITVTLHPDAYARIANQPDIIEALETKNAELASTGGSIALVSA